MPGTAQGAALQPEWFVGQTHLYKESTFFKASGRALEGASIPVISVTVMDTEERQTQDADDQQEVLGCEEATSGKRNTGAGTRT